MAASAGKIDVEVNLTAEARKLVALDHAVALGTALAGNPSTNITITAVTLVEIAEAFEAYLKGGDEK